MAIIYSGAHCAVVKFEEQTILRMFEEYTILRRGRCWVCSFVVVCLGDGEGERSAQMSCHHLSADLRGEIRIPWRHDRVRDDRVTFWGGCSRRDEDDSATFWGGCSLSVRCRK